MKKLKSLIKAKYKQIYSKISQGKNLVIFKITVSILAVVVLAIIFASAPKQPVIEQDMPLVDLSQGEVVETVVLPKTKKPSVSNVQAPSKISYQEALVLYKDSRLQLSSDNSCSPTPKRMSVLNGSKMMIDNRSSQARNVTVGSNYQIPAYDFIVVTIKTNNVPSEIMVDCGAQQNVATIVVN